MTGGERVPRVRRARGSREVSSDSAAPPADRSTRRLLQAGMNLEWPGRVWRPRAPQPEGPRTPARIEELERSGFAESGSEPVAGGRLLFGDAAEVCGMLLGEGLGGKVDLVYIDPPFASQADYVHEARLDGPADGRVVRSPAYVDTWKNAASGNDTGAYLEALAPALELLTRLLSPTGTIWVHLDWRASYLVRVLLDEMLGRDAFVNEIVWRRAPNLGRQATSHQFGRTLDTLIVYGGPKAKLHPPTRLEPIDKSAIRFDTEGRPFTTAPRGDYTDASIARLELEGRVYRTATGRAYIKYFLVKNAEGAWCRERRVDALWTDVPPLRHAPTGERTGFPTQKPRALLERIIACATPPDGLVVDLFCGSGTTASAAHALGRRFIVGDGGPMAIGTARARLLREGAALTVARCGDAVLPPGDLPQVEIGARGEGGVAVELVSPKEPAAWAIDADYDAARPFTVTWHSERTPGARAVAAARVAIVAVRPDSALAVRVYGDDGSVATQVFSSSGHQCVQARAAEGA